MSRSNTADAEARVKWLKEQAGGADIPYGRISIEALFLLPREFIDAYIELYYKALKSVGSTGYDNVGTNGGKKYKTHWFIQDERAFKKKEWLDNRLLELIRVKKPSVRRAKKCSACTKFLSEEWWYCPFCGERQDR